MHNPTKLSSVVITPKDLEEVEKFFTFFDIPITNNMRNTLDAFYKDPNLDHQNDVRVMLAEVISQAQYPVFQDDVFKQIVTEVTANYDEIRFEQELEANFTSSDQDE